MSLGREYSQLQEMIRRIRNPPTFVAKYMNINAIVFLLSIVIAAQTEKLGMTRPNGSTPAPVFLALIALVFLSFGLELAIGLNVVSASWWRMSAPDFLSIAIMQKSPGAEARYRRTLIAFYRGQEANRTLTGSTLIVGLVTGLWVFAGAISSGSVHLQLTEGLAFVVCLSMTAHYLISLIAMRKRKKWGRTTDAEIRLSVEERLSKYPEVYDAMTLEATELLIEQAELGDSIAEETAGRLENLLRSDRRRIMLLSIILGVCIALLLL